MVAWMRGICDEKMVDPRLFAAGLGRLGFAATALPWEKPFLGPLYVWAAAVRQQPGKVYVPWAVLMILDWLASRLEGGRRMEVVKPTLSAEHRPMVFYTDARASEHDACIGGYLAVSSNLKECPWFSVEIGLDLAPWLLSKGGNPKRVIAALELLATLIAVKLWSGKAECGLVSKVRAFTDNRGNSFALLKGMSTKYPLTILLMELAEELRAKDLNLDLEWIKRGDNTVADDLSNGKWEAFDLSLRESVDAGNMEWRVLKELQRRSGELYEGIKSLKLQGRSQKTPKGPGFKRSRKGKVLSRW